MPDDTQREQVEELIQTAEELGWDVTEYEVDDLHVAHRGDGERITHGTELDLTLQRHD